MSSKSAFTPEEQLTINSYDETAQQWSANHNKSGFWEQELETFKKYLPTGKIIEIGCGGGRDAKELIAAGYGYIGIDISRGLVKVAKQSIPGQKFFVQSVYKLDFPENSFDGFWSAATLLHIPKEKLSLALKEIYRVTKSKGAGFISIKEGEGERVIQEETDGRSIQRFFVFYNSEEFSSILQNNGFDILEVQRRPMSEKTIWLSFFVQVIK